MQNHYNYAYDSITGTYNFTTKNNILYRIAFIVDYTFSVIADEDIPNVFQLIVEKANDEIEPYDARVFKTVENIVEIFFQKIDDSLVYVCSDDGDKAQLRFNVFQRWYKRSSFQRYVKKVDHVLSFQADEVKIYTSFMFHKNNPDCEKLIDIYNRIEQSINEK